MATIKRLLTFTAKSTKTRAKKKCSRCKENPAQAKHSCPWQHDLHGNTEKHCDCCSSCINECVGDI